jgi:hypothetical protein
MRCLRRRRSCNARRNSARRSRLKLKSSPRSPNDGCARPVFDRRASGFASEGLARPCFGPGDFELFVLALRRAASALILRSPSLGASSLPASLRACVSPRTNESGVLAPWRTCGGAVPALRRDAPSNEAPQHANESKGRPGRPCSLPRDVSHSELSLRSDHCAAASARANEHSASPRQLTLGSCCNASFLRYPQPEPRGFSTGRCLP